MTLILAAIVLTSSAVADVVTGRYTATLVQPLTAKNQFMANGNLFRCDGSTCILVSRPIDADAVGTCRALQREVGTLSAYVADGKPFDADKLAKCNSHN